MKIKEYIHLYYNKKIPNDKKLKTIFFGMGCFWNRESLFWKEDGVFFTEVGYAEVINGITPSCSDVFDDVNHKEVVKVSYDPNIISLERLLDIFWKNHTYEKREDFPVPNLYKSVIYINKEQNEDYQICENSIKEIKENIGNKDIWTTLKYIKNYVRAKDKHQQYILRNKSS